jgi:hypothetical protein
MVRSNRLTAGRGRMGINELSKGVLSSTRCVVIITYLYLRFEAIYRQSVNFVPLRIHL